MAGTCYIFDIDGTLSDPSHRLHHILNEPKNWDAFFASCGGDLLIDHVADLLHALCHTQDIVLVSGRSDQCRSETEHWLTKHHVVYHALYMRKAGDHRHDDIVKGELLDAAVADGWKPIMAFEDRARVVDMIRKRGIPCAQVAPGDF